MEAVRLHCITESSCSGVQGALWFCVAATVVIMVGLLLLFAGMIRYAMMKNKDMILGR